jgi:hypothetical protein
MHQTPLKNYTMKKENSTKTIAKINNVSILMIENGDKLVPIRPICEALGIDEEAQRQKIKTDEILGSVTLLSKATGSDNKQYEMVCLPLKFMFGWLFTINSKNVNSEAKETVVKYKLECYEALYRHFTDHTNFIEQKQEAVRAKEEMLNSVRKNFNEAKNKLSEAREALHEAIHYPFDEWLANDRQLKINFDQNQL